MITVLVETMNYYFKMNEPLDGDQTPLITIISLNQDEQTTNLQGPCSNTPLVDVWKPKPAYEGHGIIAPNMIH